MDPIKFKQWWQGLSAGQQGQLRGLSAGEPLPDALVPGLVRYRGSVVPPEWWDSHHDRPGFPLPADVHELIHAHEPTTTADAG